MGQAEPQPRTYTPDEYFALERTSEVRHEYIDGEVFAMAGASIPHNLIKGNLIAALRAEARKRGCRVLDENVRLAVEEAEFYTYPDVLLTCEAADKRERYQVRFPVLIAEVLSPGTADYDRTEKFSRYQKIPTLQHYLLLSQSSWTVEWFWRNEAGQWVYTLLNNPAATLTIPGLGLQLPLAELYEDTDVAPLRPTTPAAAEEP